MDTLTIPGFISWLAWRRDAGETLRAIGDSFGVSHVTAKHWLSGQRVPYGMALVLPDLRMQSPRELPPGLAGTFQVRDAPRVELSVRTRENNHELRTIDAAAAT
jgi:hypothetical protein